VDENLREISPRLFKVFALSLPKGLDFGGFIPCSSWVSDDWISCGLILCDELSLHYNILVMRRREDDVWTVVSEQKGLVDYILAKNTLESSLKNGLQKELIPSSVRRHKAMHDVEKRKPSDIFRSLSTPHHHYAAWIINQVYLALPRPDPNFVSDFQTANFHTRLWELYLFACFREQGLEVFQDHRSPDFYIKNNAGSAFVEAVTANSDEPYNHANSDPVFAPECAEERQLGKAAFRYAKTLRSKLQREYHKMPHVIGKPFAIAIADFHAPGSMTWSREALPCYLYGFSAQVKDVNGVKSGTSISADVLLVDGDIPAGLFNDNQESHLSAVIYSNAGTLAKFNRMGFLISPDSTRHRITRY
jgi:hypothetical protein